MSRSSKPPAKMVDDVWTKLEQDNNVQNITDGDGQDMTVLFVGDAGSGKSTLLQSFLKPNVTKDPKPTFALEYNFIRKKQAGTSVASKSVSHIWELGGDIFEPKMLEIPLALKNIHNASVLICLDMTKPQDIVSSLLKWLSYIKDVVNRRMNESFEVSNAKITRSDVVASNYGADHPDKLKVNPSFIPIYVVLTKYDVFKNMPTIECKMIYQVVRFICHYHGANIVTVSSKEVALRDNFRSLFNNICFSQNKNAVPGLGTLVSVKLPYEVSADRAAYVRVGKDSFAAVFNLSGDQSGTNTNSKLISTESEMNNYLGSDNVSKDCWKRMFDFMKKQFGKPSNNVPVLKEVFLVQANSSSSGVAALINNHLKYEGIGEDISSDNRDNDDSKLIEANNNNANSLAHSEAEVDAMRAQKDVQLNLYVQEMLMKEQLNAKLNQPSSSSSAISGDGTVASGGEPKRSSSSSKVPRDKDRERGRDRDRDSGEQQQFSRDNREDRSSDRDRDRDRSSRDSSRDREDRDMRK